VDARNYEMGLAPANLTSGPKIDSMSFELEKKVGVCDSVLLSSFLKRNLITLAIFERFRHLSFHHSYQRTTEIRYMKFGTTAYDKLTIGYEWIVICRSIVISMETVGKFMKL
jgi:hypothetical protein